MKSSTSWLTVVLVAYLVGIGLDLRSALADPPPWAPAHGRRAKERAHHHDDDDDWWKHHDREEWRHHRRKHSGEDERCGEILDRIRFDRQKIRQIEPTGRHRKALQWYKGDVRNAQNDLARCRSRR
jgi:hypothetical protein